MDDDTKEIESFLIKAKMRIQANQRHLVRRKTRNLEQDLIDLGLSSTRDVWNTIMSLQIIHSNKPPEYDEDGSGEKVFFFLKAMPNGTTAYIKMKLKQSDNGDVCVCLSFHPTNTSAIN
ncbi:hypothetical protein ACFQZE_23750 [Paenibacillus sp. GCM10027627]|uniref:hypothetical protein n=1 Tax=unclassified Paenibacillus TaxID=185978 RepID=UPI0036379315